MVDFGCIALVALLWGAWPLVARSSGYGGPLGSLILTVFGLIPITLATTLHGAAVRPSSVALTKLAVAGVMMGAGLVAFNIVANSKMEASVSIPTIDAAMLIVSAMGAIYFFAESISPQKVIGLILLLVGIVVLRPT
jgi:drug/metabolite transporter (DMT)-like permease